LYFGEADMMQTVFLAARLLVAWSLTPTVQGESFDYVIVGGGTAGLVIANRLSEQSAVSVAVVEVGSDQRNNPNVTNVDDFTVAFNTSIDWQYPTAAQQYAGNRVLEYHQGKAIGGTSTINGWCRDWRPWGSLTLQA
jgi:choline dehydrogenase-like flavoprotein